MVNSPLKFRIFQLTKKMITTVFWDCEEILLNDFNETNAITNATYYAEFFHKLQEII